MRLGCNAMFVPTECFHDSAERNDPPTASGGRVAGVRPYGDQPRKLLANEQYPPLQTFDEPYYSSRVIDRSTSSRIQVDDIPHDV